MDGAVKHADGHKRGKREGRGSPRFIAADHQADTGDFAAIEGKLARWIELAHHHPFAFHPNQLFHHRAVLAVFRLLYDQNEIVLSNRATGVNQQ